MADEPHPPVELIRRLPTTCGPALNDQFRQWNLLFPAEQHGHALCGMGLQTAS